MQSYRCACHKFSCACTNLDSRALAHAIARELAPRSSAYSQIFLSDDEGRTVAPLNAEEPVYGAHYLPRKFKVGIAHPRDNSIDLLTQDVGFLPVLNGQFAEHYDLYTGGGLGITHNLPELSSCSGCTSASCRAIRSWTWYARSRSCKRKTASARTGARRAGSTPCGVSVSTTSRRRYASGSASDSCKPSRSRFPRSVSPRLASGGRRQRLFLLWASGGKRPAAEYGTGEHARRDAPHRGGARTRRAYHAEPGPAAVPYPRRPTRSGFCHITSVS